METYFTFNTKRMTFGINLREWAFLFNIEVESFKVDINFLCFFAVIWRDKK